MSKVSLPPSLREQAPRQARRSPKRVCDFGQHKIGRSGTVTEVETNADRAYPLACPQCKHLEGRPLRVTTVKGEAGQMTIDMHCHRCNHRWQDLVGIAAQAKSLLKGLA